MDDNGNGNGRGPYRRSICTGPRENRDTRGLSIDQIIQTPELRSFFKAEKLDQLNGAKHVREFEALLVRVKQYEETLPPRAGDGAAR